MKNQARNSSLSQKFFLFLTVFAVTHLLPQMAGASNLDTLQNIQTQKLLKEESQKSHVLIYFWATWCPDCKAKLTSDLSAYTKKQVAMIAISTDKDKSKVEQYLSKNKVNLPVYLDADKKLQKELKVFSVPTVVLLQRTAAGYNLVLRVDGRDWSQLDKKLEEL